MAKTILQLPTQRCISVWQPWAHCIIYCGKDIENRGWKTNVRGEILIHASKTQQFFSQDRLEIEQTFGIPLPDKAGMSFGAIIAVVRKLRTLLIHGSCWL